MELGVKSWLGSREQKGWETGEERCALVEWFLHPGE